MSLYKEYRPKTLDEMMGNEKTIEAIKTHFAQDPKRVSHCHIFYGGSGCGKAQPLYSKILTPTGWVTMGEIKPGDTVISGEGSPTKVLAVFPQGIRPIYTVHLDDRTTFNVADNHLNVITYKKNHKHKGITTCVAHTEVLTTEQLIPLVNKTNNGSALLNHGGIRIPNVKVTGMNNALPIHPYLLGILIGDGNLNSDFGVCLPETDVREKVTELLKYEGFVLHKQENNPKKYDYRIVRDIQKYPRSQDMKDDKDNLKNKVKTLGLNVKSIDKHIPPEYLYASTQDRVDLLKGLFDSDGCISQIKSKKGHIGISYEYSTSSARLSHDFEILVRSLGITDTVTTRIPSYTDSDGNTIAGHISYRHHLKVPNDLSIVSSIKHKHRIKDRQCGTTLSRRITGISYKGLEECQCIYVEDPCHTYITDNYTLTHNTTIARAIATEILHADPTFSIREYNSSNNRGIDTVRVITDEMKGMPLKGKSLVYIIDECFPGETEILTNYGFKQFKDLDGSEKIAQYKDDGSVEFVKPLRHIKKKHNGVLYSWNAYKNRIIRMTPHHIQPLVNGKTKEITENYIENIKFNQRKNIIVSGTGVGTTDQLSAMDRLAIISQADGAINWAGKSSNRWVISFKKDRKIMRFLKIVKDVEKTGFPVNLTEIHCERKGYKRYTYSTPKTITKDLRTHFNLDITAKFAQQFIEELVEWDGYKYTNNSYLYYSSVIKENVDFCSAVAFLCGYRSNITVSTDNRSEKFNDVYRLTLCKQLLHTTELAGKTIHTEEYKGDVYCVEVPSHKIIVRADGKFPFVTGNCHGMTNDAKRAFLKPTEDMPNHVYFFFCTTNLTQFLKGDEGKALATRSTQWKMEPLNARQLGKLVLRVADAEKFNVDDKVLTAIMDVADGSPRAALVALEKIMSQPDDIAAQLKILEGGLEEDPDTLAFCRALTAGKPSWKQIADILKDMKGRVDSETVRRGVLGYCTTIMLKNGSDRISRVMEEFAVNTYDTSFSGLVLAAWRSMH